MQAKGFKIAKVPGIPEHTETSEEAERYELVIHQEGQPRDPKIRHEILSEEILAQVHPKLHRVCADNGTTVPKYRMANASKMGDWSIVLPKELALAFEEYYPSVVFKKKVQNWTPPGGMQELPDFDTFIELTTFTRKVRGPNEKPAARGLSRNAMDRLTAHLVVDLNFGWASDNITDKNITTSFEEKPPLNPGLALHRATTQNHRKDGVDTGVGSSTIHLNVSLTGDSSWTTINWPPQLKIRVGEHLVPVDYKVMKSPNTDGLVCPRKGCHAPLQRALELRGVRMPAMGWGALLCDCANSKGKGKRPEKPSELRMKPAERLDHMFGTGEAASSQQECPYLMAGMCGSCREGAQPCQFTHSVGDPAHIECKRGYRPNGTCKNGLKCTYKHLGGNPKTGYEFDSTLGYPGEGPCTFLGWNTQGSRFKLKRVLEPARKQEVDILFLQELQVTTDIQATSISCQAARYGFRAFVSLAPTSDAKAAVAILVRKASPHVLITGPPEEPVKGRLICVPAEVCGQPTRLCSVYVPSDAGQRLRFIETLPTDSLRAGDIAQGDWNSVTSVERDTCRKSGDATIYANIHGKNINEWLAKAGLTDIAAHLHSELDSLPSHPGYTRYGKTVFTRLDRIHADPHQWTWLTAGTCFNGFDTSLSDHLPVKAEIAAPTTKLAPASAARIDPSLYAKQHIRDQVTDIWRNAYSDTSATEADKWQCAKEITGAFLLAKSKPDYSGTPAAITHAAIAKHVQEAGDCGPTTEWHTQLERLNAQLVRNKKEAARSRRGAYLATLNKEKSSKTFYRHYKAPRTTSRTPAVYVTPDWDHPDEKLADNATAPDKILEQFTLYYQWLFKPKPSIRPEKYLDLLRETKIPKEINEKLDADITDEEIRKAIRSLADGKATGPDGLGAEFYKAFEDVITGDLLRMLEESERSGALPETVRSGDITVLHKKGRTEEIRNYRPITLLNVDYKIYAKIMGFRMREALDYFVSKEQLGFVPGRIITEASHLTQLVQAYLDETNEEGLLIALDWEKAFDRVSWDFLHKAYNALGFGLKFQFRAMLMTNPDSPPQRTVKIDGERGAPFEIHSGVPQGCPFAPLAFLVCAEALTRAIKSNPDLEGISIGGTRHLISQFADDTLLYLRGYTSLAPMWDEIEEYEDASGHRANKKKFEGLRCGATRKIPYPWRGKNGLITWATKKEWVRLLGIPFWENNRDPRTQTRDTSQYWDKLYFKCLELMAGWQRHVDLTIFGRVMLVNMMIYSRFRFPCHCMVMPNFYINAIISDCKALLWDREFKPDKDSYGSDQQSRAWMKTESLSGKTRSQLGIGLLDLVGHLQALQVRQLLRYRDASQGPWKLVLDHWLARSVYGRGAPFTKVHMLELTSSTTYRIPALPTFWVHAIHAVRELKLVPLTAPSTEGALAQPIWDNPAFDLPPTQIRDFWRETMRTVTVADLLLQDGTDYPMRTIITHCAKALKVDEHKRFIIRIKGETSSKTLHIHPRRMWEDWREIVDAIPEGIMRAAKGLQPYAPAFEQATLIGPKGAMTCEPIRPRDSRDGIGKALLERVGWVDGTPLQPGGETLDSLAKLFTSPTPLGEGEEKKASKKKPRLQVVAVVSPEGEYVYGTPKLSKLTGLLLPGQYQALTLSTEGRPRRTGLDLFAPEQSISPASWWGKGITGPSATAFPEPKEWTFEGLNKPLDTITTRDLTRLFTEKRLKPPTCIKTWTDKTDNSPQHKPGQLPVSGRGTIINWPKIGDQYSTAFHPPPIFNLHFKFILQRRFICTWQLEEHAKAGCRLGCGCKRESVEHLGTCPALDNLREKLAHLTEEPRFKKPRTFLIAEVLTGSIEKGAKCMWLILWHTLMLGLIDITAKGYPMDLEKVWDWSIRKYADLTLAAAHTADKIRTKRIARGLDPPLEYPTHDRLLAPLASLTADAVVRWSDKFKAELIRLDMPGYIADIPTLKHKLQPIAFVPGN